VRLRDITDGASFTLAIVEKRDSFGWAVGGWGGSEFDVHTAPAYNGDDALARNALARFWEGEPPGEPRRNPARTEPRPGVVQS
jgi:hypothetical protein